MESEIKPKDRIRPKRKQGLSHIYRLLMALTDIYEDANATIPQRIQAAQLGLEVIKQRKPARRKTDKEKMVEAALSKSNPKKKP